MSISTISRDVDSYDTLSEEVSLEQLLEGRERPATMSGTVPIPVALDEVEELGTHELVDNPLSVALMDEPSPPPPPPRAAASNGQIVALENRVKQLEGSLNDILKTLNDLTNRVKNQIGR